jgi:hypothetical protein
MDYQLILGLVKLYGVKNDYELNYVYDAYQVGKRFFNSLFTINSSKYKSGEIVKEFLKGCTSDDKDEYLKVINKLYKIYAK